MPWDYRNMTLYAPKAGEYRWPASFVLRMQFDQKSSFKYATTLFFCPLSSSSSLPQI
jgi:hypothetical protein